MKSLDPAVHIKIPFLVELLQSVLSCILKIEICQRLDRQIDEGSVPETIYPNTRL